MIPFVQSACQDSEFVVPFIQKPVTSKDDDFATLALGDLFDVLNASENRLVVEGQRTQESAQLIFAQMQHGFAALAKENDHLRTQLIASEGRQREVEVIHKAEVKALKDEVLAAQESVKTVRKEMLQVSQKANSNVAAALAAQKVAVQTAIQTGDARVASAQRETISAMQNQEQYKNRLIQAHHSLQSFQSTMTSDIGWYERYGNTSYWGGLKQSERARDLINPIISIVRV
jgi:flagellar biosynthesis chaperone FliJ